VEQIPEEQRVVLSTALERLRQALRSERAMRRTAGILDFAMPLIRAATPDDEEAVAALWVKLLAYHRSLEQVWPGRWAGPREAWHDRLLELLRGVWRDPDRQAVFVAVEGQELIGFVRVGLHGDGPLPAHIETLFVAEEHRGAGVARALVAAGERWCLDRGADEIGVEFIARNEAAGRTYERLGYRPFLVTYMRRLREVP
jgi:GNAT superfamily N-acetyltransferase